MSNVFTNMRIFLLFSAAFLFKSVVSFSQNFEQTDSTIITVVNPEKYLKLWYGSDDFPISDFVVLPSYTVLYNKEKGIIRLLKNVDKLVVDEYNLRDIKRIMLIQSSSQNGQKIRYPLGPIEAWFTVENDSTILAGTLTTTNSKVGSAYARIAIRNNTLHVDTFPYINARPEKNNPSLQKTFYVTSLQQVGEKQILVTPAGFLTGDVPHDPAQMKGEIYVKDSEGKLTNIYSINNNNDRLLNPVQITATDQFILLYDTVINQVKIYDRQLNLKFIANLNAIGVLHEKPQRFFGKSFFWDAFNHELYYRLIFDDNGKNARSFYKVTVGSSLSFVKKIVLYTVGYTEKYINYNDVFTLSSKNKFIYTIALEPKQP